MEYSGQESVSRIMNKQLSYSLKRERASTSFLKKLITFRFSYYETDEPVIMGTPSKMNIVSRFTRPVPIGSSVGNYLDCGAGTLGVRVRNESQYFILSCNHVLARLNLGAVGQNITQPGRADNSCIYNTLDNVAKLYDFEPIVFLTTVSNSMDAAIAETDTLLVANTTPSDGYGIPSSQTQNETVGVRVKKYGKRTGLTKGKIVAINVTMGINYGNGNGTATFINQVVIEPVPKKRAFVDVGDSGSLVVTDNKNANPVALIFARSGTLGIATPINTILTRFNVQIDGK
jgi:hypothetical protein